jgi:hypothetical protein
MAVRGWFSGPILLLADGAYANGSLVGPARKLGIQVVSRLRPDARMRESNPPRRAKGKRGRKPRRGPWLPRLSRLARRWTIEQMFSVAKNQLGFDSAEVRKERSVMRHAALALAMITWVEVWARRFRRHLSARPFAANLAAVREEAVMQTIFASGPRRKGSREIAATLATLFSAATRAA